MIYDATARFVPLRAESIRLDKLPMICGADVSPPEAELAFNGSKRGCLSIFSRCRKTRTAFTVQQQTFKLTFPYFSRLPPELHAKIWREAV
jgi:hypothetical protein